MSYDKQVQAGQLMIVPPRPTPPIGWQKLKSPIGSQRQAPDQPHVWPGMQVLVTGSANAGFIAKAAERTAPDGKVVVLSDEGETLRRLEKRLAPLGFAHLVLATASPGKIPLSDHSVDRAFLMMGLRRVPDLDGTLQEAQRVLKPEGQLIVYRRFLLARFLPRQRLVSLCLEVGFDPVASHGALLHHTLTFEKRHSQP